jgi:hypothetical protein
MRTLSFIGSKHTLGPALRDALQTRWHDLAGVPLVDAFLGSGAFTLAVHDLFGDLYLNDLEKFSATIAHGLFVEPLDASSVRPATDDGYVTTTFCTQRGFWTPENGRYADGFRAWARLQPDSPARTAAIGALLCAMDARANTAAVYGGYLKKKLPKALKPVEYKSIYVGHAGGAVHITQGDAVAACLAAPANALLYLDMPYVSRSYSANYHVLNILADVDADAAVYGKSGLPSAGYNKSAWCRADTALVELGKILSGTPVRRLAMSYSTDGLMPVPAIMQTFFQNGWDVQKHMISQRRFRSHTDGEQDESELKEILFLGERRPPRVSELVIQGCVPL